MNMQDSFPDTDTEENGEMPPSFLPAVRPAHHDEDAQDAEDRLEELETKREKPRKSLPARIFGSIFEFFVVAVISLFVAVLLKTYLIQPFEIPSESMARTLITDDRILVNKLANSESRLHRGDVVVFIDPNNWLAGVQLQEPTGLGKYINRFGQAIGILPRNAGNHLVKRIIGMPGDHVECCSANGKLKINGREITEPYLYPGAAPSDTEFNVTVPAGHLWVMGDNRSNSKDSRFHQKYSGFGFVPIKNVEGRAWLRMYPFDRFARLKDESSVFSRVPAAKDR